MDLFGNIRKADGGLRILGEAAGLRRSAGIVLVCVAVIFCACLLTFVVEGTRQVYRSHHFLQDSSSHPGGPTN